MQRDYFLGGSTRNGFYTSFWEEQRGKYGFYLTGGPGSGKSTLMKTVANAFRDEEVSFYHCASDPESFDAVVLEERDVFLADATPPHEQSVTLPHITGEQIDLASALNGSALYGYADKVVMLSEKNSMLHKQASGAIGGISAMLDILNGIGKDALLYDRIKGYSERFAKRVLTGVKRTGSVGIPMNRQLSSLTPKGWITWVPDECDVIVLDDQYGAAAECFLCTFRELALHAGFDCIMTKSLVQTNKPVLHLYIPALRLVFLTSAPHMPYHVAPTMLLHTRRFYDSDKLKKQRSLIHFCRQTVRSLMNHTTCLLDEALTVHDEIETYYIAAQNREILSSTAKRLIGEIQVRFAK